MQKGVKSLGRVCRCSSSNTSAQIAVNKHFKVRIFTGKIVNVFAGQRGLEFCSAQHIQNCVRIVLEIGGSFLKKKSCVSEDIMISR